ncbi:MAG: transferase hexapeptide repeat containing protein [Thermomicrobiales bacterium]|jgi:acetyltransferase-like isoleucine patch superfamily enzyme|nr:transferase hexapeptide repeat containing protein [Thermomicrobiales bacterium]
MTDIAAREPNFSPETSVRLPPNACIGPKTSVVGDNAFKRFHSSLDPALTIGSNCTMDGVHFALGHQARVTIGDWCYFTNAILLCEEELQIGNYVVIGWNATIADTDFHPIAPAERIADAIACSPLAAGRPRPPVVRRPVCVEDDVWIGPNATILKGVHIGAGAFIEAGALVVRDVPRRARVMGNPAQVIGAV